MIRRSVIRVVVVFWRVDKRLHRIFCVITKHPPFPGRETSFRGEFHFRDIGTRVNRVKPRFPDLSQSHRNTGHTDSLI